MVVLAAIFLIFIRPMMSAGQQFVAGTYLPETAQRQDLRISVSSTGTITPIDSYKVSALVNGEIVEAPFEEGDWVEKGALLYRFDAEDAQNAVQQAQLSVAQAELGYRTAQESVNPTPLPAASCRSSMSAWATRWRWATPSRTWGTTPP